MENIKKIQDFFSRDKEGIFFHTGLKDKDNKKSYLFIDPIKKIICKNHKSIEKSFIEIEKYLKKGFYAAGFISYEAGYLFEKKLKKFAQHTVFPFFYFMIFKDSFSFKNINLNNFKNVFSEYVIYDMKPDINFDKYKQNFLKIKNLIKNGETYQINYCFKLKFKFAGNPFPFFKALDNNQKVSYAAFFKTKEFKILSFSPELFFRIKGNEIFLKPMKGTLLKNKKILNYIKKLQNEKNKAENVMIVDLIRNDLGKICKINSIKVPSLFKIEEYKTLYQMTSEIKGKLETKNLFEIFNALFPSGSVTGAPKIRAMQIIKEIEKEQRKIYTGAIGFITHKKNAVFNIPIRTILLNNNKGEIGIGSGIVNDSKVNSEFKECLGKAKFLTLLSKPFALIETMRIIKGKGYFLLNQHLKRLKKSCEFFNFKLNLKVIKDSLQKIKADRDYKIRLLVFPEGNFKIKKFLYKENHNKYIAFSKYKTNSKNIFLYHKTTIRDVYNSEYNKAKQNGFYDLIFLNEKGQVTEGCISNIFIKKGNVFYTPPVKCGILPGIFREYLLKKNPKKFKEKILYKKDITNADEIYLCNSVAGLKRVFLKNL